MKVALVGSSGYIAGYLIKRLIREQKVTDIVKIDKNDSADYYLDLEKPEEFDYSKLADFDFVVFMAAISGPDMCAREYDHCFRINVTGTNFFINQALNNNCKVLFFSSDAVFGYEPSSIYTEESETKAYTAYGKMKKAVEDEFKDNALFKAIRLSYVMSANDRFTSYCLNCIKKAEKADIFHPFYRSVISISDVEDTVIFFIYNWEKYESSFYNVAGTELVSRVRIADEINRFYEGRLDYQISAPGSDFFENRPAITQMRSIYNDRYGIIKEESFTEKIIRELEGYEL